MPKSLEEALKRHFIKQRRKGRLQDVDMDTYVFGGMRSKGWSPKKKDKKRMRSERE